MVDIKHYDVRNGQERLVKPGFVSTDFTGAVTADSYQKPQQKFGKDIWGIEVFDPGMTVSDLPLEVRPVTIDRGYAPTAPVKVAYYIDEDGNRYTSRGEPLSARNYADAVQYIVETNEGIKGFENEQLKIYHVLNGRGSFLNGLAITPYGEERAYIRLVPGDGYLVQVLELDPVMGDNIPDVVSYLAAKQGALYIYDAANWTTKTFFTVYKTAAEVVGNAFAQGLP